MPRSIHLPSRESKAYEFKPRGTTPHQRARFGSTGTLACAHFHEATNRPLSTPFPERLTAHPQCSHAFADREMTCNSHGMTSLQNMPTQIPWNDIVTKKHGRPPLSGK